MLKWVRCKSDVVVFVKISFIQQKGFDKKGKISCKSLWDRKYKNDFHENGFWTYFLKVTGEKISKKSCRGKILCKKKKKCVRKTNILEIVRFNR